MAVITPKSYREWMIYEVFVRNHPPKGNLQSLIHDIPRIRELGTRIVWLMPFYPIGRINRKGEWGSPYAIQDYRQVDPDMGSMADFLKLAETVHHHGMKLMIDIVFHHVSPDSLIAVQHPEWIMKDQHGNFSRKVPDWSDIVDLDFTQPELWDYLIGTLMFWLQAGVDGFRCDVAPMVPLEFWIKARQTIDKIQPRCVWMAESVEPHFIRQLRNQGYTCLSDSELYQVFDICYDYDTYGQYAKTIGHKENLQNWVNAVNQQEIIYPRNYVKLRFLENHDQKRAAELISDPNTLLNWTALQFFLPGAMLIYAGQEYQLNHQPSHFDPDPLNWPDLEHLEDFIRIIQKLSELKSMVLEGIFEISLDEKNLIVKISYQMKAQKVIGLFNLCQARGSIHLPEIASKQGVNLLNGSQVHILDHRLPIDPKPQILAFPV